MNKKQQKDYKDSKSVEKDMRSSAFHEEQSLWKQIALKCECVTTLWPPGVCVCVCVQLKVKGQILVATTPGLRGRGYLHFHMNTTGVVYPTYAGGCLCVCEAQLCRHLVLTEPARILELERWERPLEGFIKTPHCPCWPGTHSGIPWPGLLRPVFMAYGNLAFLTPPGRRCTARQSARKHQTENQKRKHFFSSWHNEIPTPFPDCPGKMRQFPLFLINLVGRAAISRE